MILIQSSNNYLINWTKAPTAIKEEESKNNSNNSWLRAFISFAGSLAINIALSFVTAGASLVLEPLIQIAWDSFVDYVIFKDEFDAVNFGINALVNSMPLISAGAKKLYQSSKNGLRALSKSGVKTLSQADELADLAKQVEKIGLKKGANYKSLKISKDLIKSLDNKAYQSYRAIKLLNYSNKLRKINKEIQRTRKVISAFSSPSYLVKKIFDKTINPYKKQITKIINTKYDDLINKIMPKLKKNFELKQLHKIQKKTFIPLNSKWISGVQFINSTNPTLQNFKIYFKDKVHKKPVTVLNKDFLRSYGITTAISPGAYYLNNFAWGWQAGKILRMRKQDIKAYQRFSSDFYRTFNQFLFSYKSFYSLATLKKNWNFENIGKQFKQGFYQSVFNWNSIKPVGYISKIIRSTQANKPMNLLKSYLPKKTANTIVTKTVKYKKLKGASKW